MMRKRSIMSLLLAFCLCFSMITPAMAAEVNAEAQIEAQAMSRLADFDFVQSADVNEATFSLDGESVLIQNLSETATLDEISKAELADVIEQVAEVRETEFDSGIEVIDYYCLIDDKVYFYEEAVDASDSKLTIFDQNQEDNWDFSELLSAMEENNDDGTMALASDYKLSTSGGLNIENWYGPLDKGVAARLNVNKSSISFMEATLTAPKLDDLSYVDNENVTNYIYLGFHGSNVESDIGIASGKLDKSGPIVGFKPYFLLKNNGVTDGTDVNGTSTVFTINVTPDKSGVHYFLPSTDSKTNYITMVVYKNVQDSENDRKGYVRGTISGNAVYGREMKQANVKVIMDATKTKSSQLKPITNWKIVNTLTPKEGYSVTSGAKSLTVFNNIKIDGQSVPLSICRGQIYNKGKADGWGKIVQVKSGSNLGTLTFDVICGR